MEFKLTHFEKEMIINLLGTEKEKQISELLENEDYSEIYNMVKNGNTQEESTVKRILEVSVPKELLEEPIKDSNEENSKENSNIVEKIEEELTIASEVYDENTGYENNEKIVLTENSKELLEEPLKDSNEENSNIVEKIEEELTIASEVYDENTGYENNEKIVLTENSKELLEEPIKDSNEENSNIVENVGSQEKAKEEMIKRIIIKEQEKIEEISKNLIKEYESIKSEEIKQQEERKYTPEGIWSKITKDIDLKVTDDIKYKTSNVTISSLGKNLFQKGNIVHNVIVTPQILRIPISLVISSFGKIAYKGKTKKRVEKLIERVNELPEEEIEILIQKRNLLNKYQTQSPIVFTILNERIQKYYNEKVEPLQKQVEEDYMELFKILQYLDDECIYVDGYYVIEPEEKILEKASQLVKNILKNNNIIEKKLNSKGAHAFEENTKAMISKMNLKGTTLAKRYNNNKVNEQNSKLAELSENLEKALRKNDKEKIITCFREKEIFLLANSKIKHGISKGIYDYQPVNGKLDYRNNTLAVDVLRAVAIVSMIGNISNTIAQTNYNNKLIEEHIMQDKKNLEHPELKKFDNYEATIRDGIKQQTSIINSYKENVIHSLNERLHINRQHSAEYKASDLELHQEYKDVLSEYLRTSNTKSLDKISEISNDANIQLNSVLTDVLPKLHKYAAEHPNIDMTGEIGFVNNILSNPNAITNWINTDKDILTLIDKLKKIDTAYVYELGNIKNNQNQSILTSILTYAAIVSTSNQINNTIKKSYNNNVIEMIEEHAKSSEEFSHLFKEQNIKQTVQEKLPKKFFTLPKKTVTAIKEVRKEELLKNHIKERIDLLKEKRKKLIQKKEKLNTFDDISKNPITKCSTKVLKKK